MFGVDRNPASYWEPWLGHFFHVTPADLEDWLTAQQAMSCWRSYVEATAN